MQRHQVDRDYTHGRRCSTKDIEALLEKSVQMLEPGAFAERHQYHLLFKTLVMATVGHHPLCVNLCSVCLTWPHMTRSARPPPGPSCKQSKTGGGKGYVALHCEEWTALLPTATSTLTLLFQSLSFVWACLEPSVCCWIVMQSWAGTERSLLERTRRG